MINYLIETPIFRDILVSLQNICPCLLLVGPALSSCTPSCSLVMGHFFNITLMSKSQTS